MQMHACITHLMTLMVMLLVGKGHVTCYYARKYYVQKYILQIKIKKSRLQGSNQGPQDVNVKLQSCALPTELRRELR